MPYSPLILFWIKGAVAISPHAPNSGAWRLSDLRAGKRSSEPFKADTGDSGGRARGAWQNRFQVLRLRIEAIIGSYTMDFTSIFEGRKSSGRKAVRQTPCRIHSGRQSRPLFLAFWPHLLVFLRISVRKRQCFKHAYNRGIGVSAIRMIPQNSRIFRLFTGVSRVSGVHTEKINISATKGVVFVSGEPWVGSPWTTNVNYTRERYIEKQKKNNKEDARFSVAPRIIFRVRRRESADPGFFFCFFFVRKKISWKMFFWFD